MDTQLSPSLLTILILLSEAAAGIVLGWWLRGTVRPATDDAETASHLDAQHAREALERVRALTERVAENVGAHTTRVQEISDEISAKTATSQGGESGDDILASISQLFAANEKMHEQLAQAENRMKEQAEEIESQVTIARTDALTGIDNRRAFDDDLQQCVNNWHRLKTPFSMLILDVDHFKKFNDTHGHQAGDEVLKGVARAIADCTRDVDLVSRYGGEEFAVIFPGTDLEAAKIVAEKARSAIESSVFHYQQTELSVRASLGIAQALDDETGASLVKRADTALYLAKERSRNCCFYHDGQRGHLLEFADEKEAEPPETAPADEESPAPQIDPQTGLPDRAVLLEDATRRIAEWRRYESPLSTISIIIDDFDERIEQFGNSARDLMLKVVTQFLQASMRDMDAVARCETNLFAILIPGVTLEHAVGVAGRLRMAISRCAVQLAGTPFEVTVSLGVATATADDDAASLLGRSELAAAHTAETGGNATSIHDGEHCERIDVELEIVE